MADKGEFEVKRDATIPASRAAVYALLVDFHRWREWSPWEDIDPDLSRTYSGPDAGVGAVYEWVGNRKAGAGRMEITDAVESSKVQIALAVPEAVQVEQHDDVRARRARRRTPTSPGAWSARRPS